MEYKTTSAEWWESYVTEGWRKHPDHFPDPVSPPGRGWRLVSMAVTSERLFWAWERDRAPKSADSRKMVLDSVIANPGKNASELAKLSGLSESTVRRHLADLERDEFVERASSTTTSTAKWFLFLAS